MRLAARCMRWDMRPEVLTLVREGFNAAELAEAFCVSEDNAAMMRRLALSKIEQQDHMLSVGRRTGYSEKKRAYDREYQRKKRVRFADQRAL